MMGSRPTHPQTILIISVLFPVTFSYQATYREQEGLEGGSSWKNFSFFV